jgi:endogenous inhibitor of DNA gyrase (YacG/DUF329 family)
MPQKQRVLIPKIKKKCKHCGKEFLAKMSNRVFCSESHRVMYRRNHNSQYYRVSLEATRKNIRKAKDFLFSKLGHKCVICGKSNHRILFHEIHGKPHKTLTYNQAVERWQDFVSICDNCHHALHRYIRYKEKMDKLSMEFFSKGLNKTKAS